MVKYGDLDEPVGRPPVEQPPEQRHPPARAAAAAGTGAEHDAPPGSRTVGWRRWRGTGTEREET